MSYCSAPLWRLFSKHLHVLVQISGRVLEFPVWWLNSLTPVLQRDKLGHQARPSAGVDQHGSVSFPSRRSDPRRGEVTCYKSHSRRAHKGAHASWPPVPASQHSLHFVFTGPQPASGQRVSGFPGSSLPNPRPPPREEVCRGGAQFQILP